MSIWIFDLIRVKIGVGILLFTVLAACGGSRPSGADRVDRAAITARPVAPTVIDVSGQKVVIQGPPGFCVDRQTSQIGGDTAFVLLGNCAVVSPSSRAAQPKVKALLTASVSASRPGVATVAQSVNGMDQFFRSDTGRTALSRDSDPSKVKILDTFQSDNAFFLRARDSSEGIVPGAANDYWRSYFDLNGQIVSVSVIGFQSSPLSPEAGLATVREFSQLIRSKNGGAPAPVAEVVPIAEVVPVAVVEEQTASQPAQNQPKKRVKNAARTFWRIGLLRKLLN
jgi:hypothetical protein